MELVKIWEVIQRRRWLIIQALIVITLTAFLGSYFITPSFQTSSKIMIKRAKTSAGEIGNIGLSNLSSIITATPDVDVNRLLATSSPIIDRVVEKLQLRTEKGNMIKAKDLTQTGMVSTMKRRIFSTPNINITRYQNTDILQIVASSSDPEEAMMMANTLAETMVNENQTQTRAEYRSALIFVETQIEKVKGQYNAALQNLTDFRKDEKTIDLTMETKVATEKMAALMKQKEDNIIDLAEARAKLNRMKKQLTQQGAQFLFASTLQENPQIEILMRRLTEIKLQLSEASTELTGKHPKILSLKEKLRTAEDELKREIKTYETSAPGMASLERQIVALEAHLQGVDADIEKYLQFVGRLPEKAFKQASLDLELNVSQRLYSNLLDYLYQIGTAEATTLSQIRVVVAALRPISPVSPNKLLNTILGIFLGLVFGVGLAFLFEYLDDTVRTPEDIREFKPTALIGIIPLLEQNKNPLITERDSDDPVYECYRKIRTHLKFVNEGGLRSLLVTCAGPGEGKSTTIVNLAIALSRDGQRVAIVDLDLRRPSIHDYLELPNDLGTASILEGRALVDEAIQRTRIQGLNVITSGPLPPDGGELIESVRIERFMSELKNRFDMVLIDSAPLLIKSESLVLAKHSDGLIVLLESGKTTRHAIQAMLEILTNANIKPLGFILNKMPIQQGKFLYAQYYQRY